MQTWNALRSSGASLSRQTLPSSSRLTDNHPKSLEISQRVYKKWRSPCFNKTYRKSEHRVEGWALGPGTARLSTAESQGTTSAAEAAPSAHAPWAERATRRRGAWAAAEHQRSPFAATRLGEACEQLAALGQHLLPFPKPWSAARTCERTVGEAGGLLCSDRMCDRADPGEPGSQVAAASHDFRGQKTHSVDSAANGQQQTSPPSSGLQRSTLSEYNSFWTAAQILHMTFRALSGTMQWDSRWRASPHPPAATVPWVLPQGQSKLWVAPLSAKEGPASAGLHCRVIDASGNEKWNNGDEKFTEGHLTTALSWEKQTSKQEMSRQISCDFEDRAGIEKWTKPQRNVLWNTIKLTNIGETQKR